MSIPKYRTSEYVAWQAMLQRCYNPKHPAYKYYGHRGITVDPAWRNSFDKFISDLGWKPSPKLTLERKDNNKGYYKENCAWVTQKDQCRNRRSNNIVIYGGVSMPLIVAKEQADHHLTEKALRRRVSRGWSVEDAVNTRITRDTTPKELEYLGVVYNQKTLAEFAGISAATLRKKLIAGLSVADIVAAARSK